MIKRHLQLALCLLLGVTLTMPSFPAGKAEAGVLEKPVKVVSSSDTSSGTTLVLSDQNKVWAWGNSGLTGRGGYSGALPNLVRFFYEDGTEMTDRITEIGSGNEHSAVLTETGHVWTWGENFSGMLGDGTNEERYTPVQVKTDAGLPLSDVYDIAVGINHTLALKTDGTVWAWGSNYAGQLGDGNSGSGKNSVIPVQVMLDADTPLTGVIQIAAGESFSMALTNEGKLYSWGDNYFGKLGINVASYVFKAAHPVEVTFPVAQNHTISRIFTNASSSSAFYTTVSGAVYGWGGNTSGQLGNGDFVDYMYGEPPVAAPVEIVALSGKGVLDIQSGQQHTLVLTADGTVWGMGTDSHGQILRYSPTYDPSVYKVFTPLVLDASLNGAKAIGAGPYHSFVIMEDGTMLAFGDNGDLQLGLPEGSGVSKATTPMPVQPLTESGYTISGTAVNAATGLPLGGFPVRLSAESPNTGTLTAVTDATGRFTFTNVFPGPHDFETDVKTSGSPPDVPVNITSDRSDYHLSVAINWAPDAFQFTDTNASPDIVSGRVEWNAPMDFLTDALYEFRFADESGTDLAVAATGSPFPPFFDMAETPLPAAAKYLKLYVKILPPHVYGCSDFCDIGVWIPLELDLGASFFDFDLNPGQVRGTLSWQPAGDESDLSKYHVYWMDDARQKIGSVIQEIVTGSPEYKLSFAPNTVVPEGAAYMAIFAVDGIDREIDVDFIPLLDADRDHLDLYISWLGELLNPGGTWTITEVARNINADLPDLNDDASVDKEDALILLKLLKPVRVATTS